MYESYHDVLYPYFGQQNIQIHFMDTDKFILIVSTIEINEDLNNLKVLFDFNILNKEHSLFSNEN